MKVDVRVLGLRELQAGLDSFIGELIDEIRPGFIPQRRYRGQGGAPFSYERVELVATRKGFVVRGEGF